MKGKVYLAGPMSGKTWDEMIAWRNYVDGRIREFGIDTISPCRGVNGFQLQKINTNVPHPGLTDKAALDRCRADVLRADMLIVNLQDAKDVSIGSVFEMAWADIARKPMCVILPSGCAHDHAFVRHSASWIVDSLDMAVEITATFFQE